MRRATFVRHIFADGKKFLSTLSLRRATPGCGCTRMWRRDFYPRSPCGERLYQHSTIGSTTADFYPRSPCGERRASCRPQGLGKAISIHALLAESDYWRMAAVAGCDLFLSTLSLRRATPVLIVRGSAKLYFYPRSPCGERLHAHRVNADRLEFLSTLSLRRATAPRRVGGQQ